MPRYALVALLLFLAVPALAEVRVENLETGATLRYPIALLRGMAARDAREVRLSNETSTRPDGKTHATVVDGRFVALVELVPGENELRISDGRGPARAFKLRYTPMSTSYRVNAVYVTAKDGDTRYLTQLAADRQNYQAKLDTALKLMQTFTAERLAEAGFGRRTFNLELDQNGHVAVHTLAYPAPAEELRAKDGDALYPLLSGWVGERLPTDHAKNVVVMAFTGYDAAARRLRGHTALGGGGSGVFSANGMCAWPESPRDVERAFEDATPVNAARVFDDSAGRGALWALASTTIGATLHELGHTFALPHSKDAESIMSRGFDHLNRAFTLVEPPGRGAHGTVHFKPDEAARFDAASAACLAAQRWFEPDEHPFRSESPPRIAIDWASGQVVIRAPYGIRVVHVFADDGGDFFEEHFHDEPPLEVRYARATIRKRAGAPRGVRVFAADTEGNSCECDEGALHDPALFLRGWRLSPKPIPWASLPAAPPLDRDAVEAIATSLRAESPVTDAPEANFPYRSFDLGRRFGYPTNVLCYALHLFEARERREALLLAGGDDGLRVWVNGALAIDHTSTLACAPDSCRAKIVLERGENAILVESQQADAGWGFAVRLANLYGQPLPR